MKTLARPVGWTIIQIAYELALKSLPTCPRMSRLEPDLHNSGITNISLARSLAHSFCPLSFLSIVCHGRRHPTEKGQLRSAYGPTKQTQQPPDRKKEAIAAAADGRPFRKRRGRSRREKGFLFQYILMCFPIDTESQSSAFKLNTIFHNHAP